MVTLLNTSILRLNKLNKTLLFAIIAIILAKQVSALIINEVMANTDDDTYNEWIELYNDDISAINIYAYAIGDDTGNDTIEGGLFDGQGTIIPAYGYAIITDDATRVYNNFETDPSTIRLYVDDSSIGNGLKNDGDAIYLYNGNQLIDQVTYTTTVKGKSNAFFNSTWNIAEPTPGYANNGSILYATTGCDWFVEILADEIFESGEDFDFRVKATKLFGNSTSLTGTVRIEDLFGNTVKVYTPWTEEPSTYHKTSSIWTPNLQDRSYLIKSDIFVACAETNLGNNHAEKLVTMKGSPTEEGSSINIEKIYDLGSDNKARFGQTIKVKLEVYKGKTTKDSISLWIADEDDEQSVSKQSRTNIYTKYQDYSLTLPIQLYPNCDYEHEEGTYTIFVEGLGEDDTEEIEIEGITEDLCDRETKSTYSYELSETPTEISIGDEFDLDIKIKNTDNAPHEFEVWSYVYRGSKSYSGEREANKKRVQIASNDIEIVELKNQIDEAAPGDYNLKIKIKRDDQKTTKELTNDVVVTSSPIELSNEQVYSSEFLGLIDSNSPVKILKTPVTIYESTNIQVKKLTLYFVLILALLLDVILILQNSKFF